MQSWQTVVTVACVAVALVARGAAHPRAAEEAREEVQRGPSASWIPLETGDDQKPDMKHVVLPEEESKKIARSASQEEDDKKTEEAGIKLVPVEIIPQRPRISVSEEKKDDKLGSVAELSGGEQKEDDATRSKKSPDVREMSFHTSPTTTVCIQVRSDHRPNQVVCGPQVGDDKKEEKPMPSARFAYGPQQAYYYPQEQAPLPYPPPQKAYFRATPQDIQPSRPAAAMGQQPQRMMIPQPMPGSPMSPQAARGPMRRTQPEDDNTLKPEPQPVAPVQPYRIVPAQGPPTSVVVHKQYYQAPPIPYTTNLIAPAPTPLRFNCALQPEGAQFIQPYGSPLLRNAAPGMFSGYLPMSGEVIIPDLPTGRMAQGSSDAQGYYYDSQGRAAQPEEMMEYSADPWVGTTFVGEDGQLYKIDDSQGRSAAEDLYEQGYLGAAPSGMSMDDLRSKYQMQEEELKQRSDKVAQLQKQLRELQQRSAMEEEGKKKSSQAAELPKESTVPARETGSDTSEEPKKQEQKQNSKRHLIRRSNRR